MSIIHIGATRIRRNHHVTTADLNRYGMMHGGRLLMLADETGFLAARAFCGQECLTVAVHRARFHRPVCEGQVVTVSACVALTGRTSLWTPVQVFAADADRPIMEAVVTYVAVDDTGTPAVAPRVSAATPGERRLQQEMRRLMAQVRDEAR